MADLKGTAGTALDSSTSAADILLLTSPSISSAASCNPSSAAPLRLLPTLVIVGAAYSTGSGEAMLQCSVSDAQSGSVVARVSLPIVVQRTLWPIWEDALLLLTDGSVLSTRQGWNVNASDALVAAASVHGAGGASVAKLDDALALPAAVFTAASAVVSMWSPLPNNSAGGTSVFALTLTGPTRIILRALQPGTFANGTTVMLGDAACTAVEVSQTGDFLLLTTPAVADVCPQESAAGFECGYVTLTVDTTAVTAVQAEKLNGAALSCPPFCPGAVGDRAFIALSGGYGPSVNPLTSEGFVLTLIPPRSAQGTAALSSAFVPTTAASVGIYYALQCYQSGRYTNPLSGACINASNPASLSCAYGSGDGCRVCPSGALCPGGNRMWSRAGYWAAYDTSGTVTPCSPPDPESRCTGWNVALGATICGLGYLQGSYSCGACMTGYFLKVRIRVQVEM